MALTPSIAASARCEPATRALFVSPSSLAQKYSGALVAGRRQSQNENMAARSRSPSARASSGSEHAYALIPSTTASAIATSSAGLGRSQRVILSADAVEGVIHPPERLCGRKLAAVVARERMAVGVCRHLNRGVAEPCLHHRSGNSARRPPAG
jgi:hypothetical protein